MPTASPARPFGGYTLLAELTTSSSGSAWVACETEGPDDGELYEILRLHRPTMRDAALAGAFATGAAAARDDGEAATSDKFASRAPELWTARPTSRRASSRA